MSCGIAFYDSEGDRLKLDGSWQIVFAADGKPRLRGDGVDIELPSSIFNLEPRLSPEQLDAIRKQIPGLT